MGRHAGEIGSEGRFFRVFMWMWMIAVFARGSIALVGATSSVDVESGGWELADGLLVIPLAIGGIGSAVSFIRAQRVNDNRDVECAAALAGTEPEPVTTGQVTKEYFSVNIMYHVVVLLPCVALFFAVRYVFLDVTNELLATVMGAVVGGAWLWPGGRIFERHLEEDAEERGHER